MDAPPACSGVRRRRFTRRFFMSGKNSELIGFWVTPDVKANIQERAQKSKLTVSTFLRILMEKWLEIEYRA